MRGVYAITHTATEKSYVGSSVSVRVRWRNHRHQLNAGTHHCPRLQNAWRKYGAEAFTFAMLEHVPAAADPVAREQVWMDATAPYYNICRVAGSALGRKHSEATKRKIAEIVRGRETSPETRERLSRALKGRVGTRLGTKSTPEHVAKIRATRLKNGKRWTPEMKQHMSDVKRGLPGTPHSAESRTKISAGLRGRKVSDESRRKMSEAAKRRWAKQPA